MSVWRRKVLEAGDNVADLVRALRAAEEELAARETDVRDLGTHLSRALERWFEDMDFPLEQCPVYQQCMACLDNYEDWLEARDGVE